MVGVACRIRCAEEGEECFLVVAGIFDLEVLEGHEVEMGLAAALFQRRDLAQLSRRNHKLDLRY
jgi:hypothetical protein